LKRHRQHVWRDVHISESVFVSFVEKLQIFMKEGLRIFFLLVHYLCCMPLSGGRYSISIRVWSIQQL